MLKRKHLFLILGLALCVSSIAIAQKRAKSNGSYENKPFVTPKLVVGIVVDQMRYDYLTRFWDHYGDGGF